MIPADGKSFWLRFYFPHPGEAFDRLHLYNQFEVTNHTILLIDGIIIYLLGIVLSVILSLVIYNRKKMFYEISSYRRELTNIMAHDLKTPLMVLRGNAENLNDILSDEREIDRKKGKKYASGFIRNVDYMNELVNKTLTLSSLESEADRLDKKQISIKALIEGAKEKCDDILSERQINVEFMGDDFNVLADEYLLGEAFRNLIDNASKYADENTSIQVFLEKRKIFISNMASELTEKDLKKINNPFAKKDKSRGGRKGSGIGLSIVKNIVELHGWDFKTKLRDNIFIAEIKL
jgi:signal transduction histidine kinase